MQLARMPQNDSGLFPIGQVSLNKKNLIIYLGQDVHIGFQTARLYCQHDTNHAYKLPQNPTVLSKDTLIVGSFSIEP